MSEHSARTVDESKWLHQPVPRSWWLGKASYFQFMMRELSCVFVGWFAIYLLMLFRAVGQGADSYQAFLAWSGRPVILLLNVVTLAFVLLHAVTFFNLTPQALVLRAGGKRVPDATVAMLHFGAWVVVSVIVGWILLGA